MDEASPQQLDFSKFSKLEINGVHVDFDRNVLQGKTGEHRLEPKLAELLWVLVDNVGEVVTRDQLIDRVWDGAAGADQSLTNTISQLRKHFVECGAKSILIETIPKRGYRFDAEVKAFNGRLVASNQNSSQKSFIGQYPLIILLGVFLVLGAALIVYLIRSPDQSPPESIAGFNKFQMALSVADPQSELQNSFARDFRQGAKETFATNRLTLVQSSDTVQPEAEFRINAEVAELSENLTVSVDLIHNPTNVIIWSSQQSRTGDDAELFAEHLSMLFSNTLRCVVYLRQRFGNLTNPDLFIRIAQECYVGSGGEFGYYSLSELTRDYLSIVPGLSESHARHGTALALNLFLFPFVPEDEMTSSRAFAYKHLNKALELDPENSWALMGLAYLPDPEVSSAKRLEYLKTVLQKDPEILMSRVQIGHQLSSVGRVEDARGYYDRVVEDFPLEEQWVSQYWRKVMASSPARVRVARNMMQPYLDRFPDSALLSQGWFEAEFWYGDPDIARELAVKNEYTEPYTTCMEFVLVAHENQTKPDVNQLREICMEGAWKPEFMYFGRFGFVDEALEMLEFRKDMLSDPAAVLTRRHMFEPFMAPVHNDPRFFEFSRDIGLVDYWVSTDQWPDFCEREDLSYDCRELAKTMIGNVSE